MQKKNKNKNEKKNDSSKEKREQTEGQENRHGIYTSLCPVVATKMKKK